MNRTAGKPDLPKVIESLDSLAQVYLNEINTYTKKYIDDNLKSLVSLVALYQQVAPSVYVLNPTKDLKYFLKVDSSMFSRYPNFEPVISLHEQVKELAVKVNSDSNYSTWLHQELWLPKSRSPILKEIR